MCKKELELVRFSKNRAAKDGYQDVCKPCDYIKGRNWEKRNPAKVQSKNRRKGWRYANIQITEEQYFQMIKRQNGLCAICQIQPKKLCVDHNHKTGQVRELLCQQCNLAIGNVKEDFEILKRMVEYLWKFKHLNQSQLTTSIVA